MWTEGGKEGKKFAMQVVLRENKSLFCILKSQITNQILILFTFPYWRANENDILNSQLARLVHGKKLRHSMKSIWNKQRKKRKNILSLFRFLHFIV